ncbi:hypothetical protein [Geminicoccus roseus]|uniref:hypothetical protein n=1 Tax=Geminicoccus roseus TaxID=404900 RepID=UPI0003FC0523|nr:hypothetical protein [Geminicoccus roseus]
MTLMRWLKQLGEPPMTRVAAWVDELTQDPDASEVETELDLGSRVRRRYHLLARDRDLPRPGCPAWIVGIEKTGKQLVGWQGGKDAWPLGGRGMALRLPADAEPDFVRNVRDLMDDQDGMFVSHIAHVGGEGRPWELVYDLFDDMEQGRHVPGQAWLTGWEAMETTLVSGVTATIRAAAAARRPVTHLILGAMGWDNDQAEALANYRLLIAKTAAGADAAGLPFRPLFVGITWPSVWRPGSGLRDEVAKLVGYAAKADDADEVGLTYFAWLSHRLVEAAQAQAAESQAPLRALAIGHSFGGRIVTRAAFTGALLEPKPPAPGLDAVVGLQPAFSVNRFLAGQGDEGAPYSGWKDVLGSGCRLVFTTSDHDMANPQARLLSFAEHLGGFTGRNDAMRHAGVFVIHAGDADGVLPEAAFAGRDRIILVDATAFVAEHSDVFHEPVGRLMAGLLRAIEADNQA